MARAGRRAGIVAASLAGLVLAACATNRPRGVEAPRDANTALYASKCQGCHRLYPPEAIDKTRWPSILDRMARKAKLTADQKLQIDARVSAFAPK
jgi:hypothetical protein